MDPRAKVSIAAGVTVVALCAAFAIVRPHGGDASPASSSDVQTSLDPQPASEPSSVTPVRTSTSTERMAESPLLTDEVPAAAAQLAPTSRQTAIATSFQEAYQSGDASALGAFLGEDDYDMEAGRERIDWFKSRVGECEQPPVPIRVLDERRSRFAFRCEDGVLELRTNLDEDGNVDVMATGVRDKQAPLRVRAAADQSLELIDAWDEGKFRAAFTDRFDVQRMRDFFGRVRESAGHCEIFGNYVTSYQGALYKIDCTHGERTLILGLEDDEDLIRRYSIRAPIDWPELPSAASPSN